MNKSIKINAQKVKERIFDPNKRKLCECYSLGWCGLEDGYCPRYDCGALDRLKRFTDRQWENAVRYCFANYIYDNIDALAEDVLEVLRYRRPRG